MLGAQNWSNTEAENRDGSRGFSPLNVEKNHLYLQFFRDYRKVSLTNHSGSRYYQVYWKI